MLSEVIEDPYFVVDVKVGRGNSIEVQVDGDDGIAIDKCVAISRHIEGNLDREIEDYSLDVSSPGLGRPFKVYRQYVKNIEQTVEVTPKGLPAVVGVLKSVDQDGFEIETITKQKVEGSKKKVEVVSRHRFSFEQGADVKNIILFK